MLKLLPKSINIFNSLESLEHPIEHDGCNKKIDIVLQKLNSLESQIKNYFTENSAIPIVTKKSDIPTVNDNPSHPNEIINDKNDSAIKDDQGALFEEIMLECKSIDDLRVNLPEFEFEKNNSSPAFNIKCDLCTKNESNISGETNSK